MNRALPWLTYPAIEYLGSLNWRGHHVLEWGAGNSTLWWASQGAQVLAVEHNPGWYHELRGRLQANVPDAARIDLRLAAGEEYAELPRGLGPFDLVVIDGESRFRCAEVALAVTAPTGAIVLDNAEQPWAPPGKTGFPILELLAGHGWQRVDFHGFAPGVARPHCTSLFFRAAAALFDQPQPPRRLQGIVPG